jgi:hypothetical protein
MNTANSGMQAMVDHAAVKQSRSTPLRAVHFLSHLLNYTLAAFALATLTLFGVNAGLNHVTPSAGGAAPIQEHGSMPGFAEKLVGACWQGPQATVVATPAAQCMALAGAALQHVAGVAGAGKLMERLGTAAFNVALGSVQKALRLAGPARFDHSRSLFSLF